MLGSFTVPKSCFAGVPSCAATGPAEVPQRKAVTVSRKIVPEIDLMPIRRKSPDRLESTVKQDFGEMEMVEALPISGR
jgi:hypothetical protein